MTEAEWLACENPAAMLIYLRGCIDPAILSHLRGPRPHVRGCWALDLILGKQ
jgi:hypothetical protein